ncbi:MAG: hypothetical protein AB7O37_20600 [Vicinamibacteria bacterium]
MNARSVSRDRLRAAALELVDALAEVIAEAAAGAGAGRPERLLDYPELARRLGVHVKTARRAGAAGAWPEVRTFGGVKVREVDLDAAIRRELVNILLPLRTYSGGDFADLEVGLDGKPRPLFLGVAEGISPNGIARDGSTGYRTYEIADTYGAPAGLGGVDAVFAYVDQAAADARDQGRRLLLVAGTDYQVDLGAGTIEVLSDVQVLEVVDGENALDWNDGSVRAATITPGLYTPRTLAAAVQAAMIAAGTAAAVASYSETAHVVTIARSSGSPLSLLLDTGAAADRGIWRTLGYTGGSDLAGLTSYTAPQALFVDADLDHVLQVNARGLVDDAAGTYTGTPGALLELGPDFLAYLAGAVAGRPELVDVATQVAGRAAAPQLLTLYLASSAQLREVLEWLEYSGGADVVSGDDGRLYYVPGDAEVPPQVVDLYDRDFLAFAMGKTWRDVYAGVVIEYAADPTTGNVSTRAQPAGTAQTAVPTRYGRPNWRAFRTLLRSSVDATARAIDFAGKAGTLRRVIRATVKGKLARATVGTKVRVTRARGISTTGRLDAVLFRVLSIEKDPLRAEQACSLVEV